MGILDILFESDGAMHRDAFYQFPFRWIYYCHSSKSTRKETVKTHLCAMLQICPNIKFQGLQRRPVQCPFFWSLPLKCLYLCLSGDCGLALGPENWDEWRSVYSVFHPEYTSGLKLLNCRSMASTAALKAWSFSSFRRRSSSSSSAILSSPPTNWAPPTNLAAIGDWEFLVSLVGAGDSKFLKFSLNWRFISSRVLT